MCKDVFMKAFSPSPRVPESPANLPPSDNQTKLSEKEVVASSKEQEAIASGKEEVVTSPKEEEVFNRLWNIGRSETCTPTHICTHPSTPTCIHIHTI